MEIESTGMRATGLDKILAVCSLATFWFLPFGSLVAIAAVWKTQQLAGWPRQVAVAGGVLATIWTVMFAAVLLWLACLLWFGA